MLFLLGFSVEFQNISPKYLTMFHIKSSQSRHVQKVPCNVVPWGTNIWGQTCHAPIPHRRL